MFPLHAGIGASIEQNRRDCNCCDSGLRSVTGQCAALIQRTLARARAPPPRCSQRPGSRRMPRKHRVLALVGLLAVLAGGCGRDAAPLAAHAPGDATRPAQAVKLLTKDRKSKASFSRRVRRGLMPSSVQHACRATLSRTSAGIDATLKSPRVGGFGLTRPCPGSGSRSRA